MYMAGTQEYMAGRPPAITADDVVDAFCSRDDPAEPLTAQDISDHANCSRRVALEILRQFSGDADPDPDKLRIDPEDVGLLESKQVGARGRVFWLPLDDHNVTPSVCADDAD